MFTILSSLPLFENDGTTSTAPGRAQLISDLISAGYGVNSYPGWGCWTDKDGILYSEEVSFLEIVSRTDTQAPSLQWVRAQLCHFGKRHSQLAMLAVEYDARPEEPFWPTQESIWIERGETAFRAYAEQWASDLCGRYGGATIVDAPGGLLVVSLYYNGIDAADYDDVIAGLR